MFKVWFASKLALCGWSWKNTLPKFSNLTSKSKIKQTETLLLLFFFHFEFLPPRQVAAVLEVFRKVSSPKKNKISLGAIVDCFSPDPINLYLPAHLSSESQHDGDTSLDRSIIRWGMREERRNGRDEKNGRNCQAANPQTNNNFLDFIPFFSPFGELCKLYAIVRKRWWWWARREELTTIRFIVKYWKLSHEKLASVLGWALSFCKQLTRRKRAESMNFSRAFFLFSSTCLNSIETLRKRALSAWNQCRIYATREWTLGNSFKTSMELAVE